MSRFQDFRSPLKMRSFQSEQEFAENSWKKLDNAIQLIYRHQAGDLKFDELYRIAYNMVLFQCGDKLYSGLVETLTNQLQDIARTIEAAQGSMFLVELNKQWMEHNRSLEMIRDVLMYMDRTYVHKNNKIRVHDLGLKLWQEQVLLAPKIRDQLRQTLLEIVDKDQNGETVDRKILGTTTQMLADLEKEGYQEFERAFVDNLHQISTGTRDYVVTCDYGSCLKKDENGSQLGDKKGPSLPEPED